MTGWVIIAHISYKHSHRPAGMMVLGKVLCYLKTSLLCEGECDEELVCPVFEKSNMNDVMKPV